MAISKFWSVLLKRAITSYARKCEEDKHISSRELYAKQKESTSLFKGNREPQIWRNVSNVIDSPYNDDVLRAMDEIDADTKDNTMATTLDNDIIIGSKWLKHNSYVVTLDNIKVIYMDNFSQDKDGIRQIQIVLFTANPYISGHFLYEGYSYKNAQAIAEAVSGRSPGARFKDVSNETPERQHEIFKELDSVYPRRKS